MTKNEFAKLLQSKLTSEYGVDLSVASTQQIYRTLALICRRQMSDNHKKFQSRAIGSGSKQVYYLCMEFLMGRSLKTSLYSLGLNEVAEAVLADADIRLDSIYEEEPDAGLGNGGLGRLAACYLDGMATTGICGTGHSILYEYGIFKQKLIDGWQQERADNWLPGGQVWLKSHPDQAIEVRFDGEIHETWEGSFHNVQHVNYNRVLAVPSDMYVQGYDGQGVAKLRLWQAKAPDFDMNSFNAGEYSNAMNKNASAELISKILYPNDNHVEGKILRLRQQYFLTAAAIGDIVHDHLSNYETLDNLPDKVAIQLNDTHPTLAIPEMMRILLDECGYDWDKSFSICQRVFAYTNHTVMAEALEKWNVDIFKMTLPRIYQIVKELDNRCRAELNHAFPGDWGKIDYMAPIGDNQVRMANICAYTAHSINGVSKLHSEIIKDSVFHDYYLFKPDAFKNVTNGIAYRRWLLASNQGLCNLLDDTIGTGYKKDASELKKFEKFADDKQVLKKLEAVKLQNKKNFADYLAKSTGQIIDPNSIFDVQVKRMHEYKRQHLNALNIASEYLYLKENPNADFVPKTYIFGAKAAPGYYMAKQMIRMICKLGQLIDSDPVVREKLRIVYLEEYCVSLSERLMPASEVSEQISLAGTEASGTGNMKFMLNGALTLGTMDGANVEIVEEVGKENAFIFGLSADQVIQYENFGGYNPMDIFNNDQDIRRVLMQLINGTYSANDTELFRPLYNSLLNTQSTSKADTYFILADFKAYAEAQRRVEEAYRDEKNWAKSAILNVASAGKFSSDRTIEEYVNDIWHLDKVILPQKLEKTK